MSEQEAATNPPAEEVVEPAAAPAEEQQTAEQAPAEEEQQQDQDQQDTASSEQEGQSKEEDDFYGDAPDHVPGEVDDLAKLTHLSQQTLLDELKVRYNKDVIYTFVSDILVAVNPFKTLPIYGKMNMQKYYKQHRSKVSPHAYAIGDAAYHNLFDMNKSQCVVISGESGAGKTESAKIVVNYIIELCRSGAYGTDLEEQILQLNPLLEAFGNAQTIMNDNSSRFGKYTRLQFDSEGQVMGVQLSEYLLEKSRVVEQSFGERNFHVFYYMLATDNLADYGLDAETRYPSLGGKPWDDNRAMYEELLDALELVGFTESHQNDLHSILAAIVHLCCIEFKTVDEHAEVKDTKPVEQAARLLKVKPENIAEALLGLNTVTRGEAIRRLYKEHQAYDCRDALAKSLYASVFGWIVGSINEQLAPEQHQLKKAMGRPGAAKRERPAYEIGVLDIFGFENLKVNSFEQMCINVTHEQLQYFFNQHTFRLELEEYELEGISGADITFTDNKPLIDMFLAKPMGVFGLLDEECTFPQATDESFVDKLVKHFGDNRDFVPTKVNKGYPSFTIKHFAADVEYNCRNMLEKNKDNLAADIVELMQGSDVEIISDIFNGEILPTGQIRAIKRSEEDKRIRRGKELESPDKQAAAQNKANRRAPSLSTQFRNSLSNLIEHMTACFPHFIRCIKPNFEQLPNDFDDDFVMKQLGYTGVLEATRIRQEGYSWRPSFAEFVRRYKILAFPVTKLAQVKETEASAVKIIQHCKLQKWKVGKTKLFMKYYHVDQLEALIDKFHKDVVRTQCAVRSHFARKVYEKKLERARMGAAERAEAERREREERERLEAKKREEQERLLEQQRLERERAELEARKAEEERRVQELAAKQAEAEAERARQQAQQAQDKEEAVRARKLAEEKEREAEAARQEREKAIAEAEQARHLAELREQELSELAKAAEDARQKAEEAAKEIEKQKLERSLSRKKRHEEAERMARAARLKAEEEARAAEEARIAREQAEEEARRLAEQQRQEEQMAQAKKEAEYEEKLRKMEEEARIAREKAEEQGRAAEEALRARTQAEEQARRAEEERKAEQERLKQEREEEAADLRAADFRRSDFSFRRRVAMLMGDNPISSSDVVIEDRVVRGWLKKLGHVRKNWRNRYLVVDINDMMLKYYGNEQCKREKATIPIDELLRVFKPQSSSATSGKFSKHQDLFMIETLPRTYYFEAPSDDALKLWIVVFKILANPDLKDSKA